MNKIKYLMFCFVLLGMPSQYSLAGNIHHFKNKEYFYQMNEMIAKKVMQENLRQTPTYQRIMKLCLHPDQLQNYVYSSSAAGQAFSIGSGDPDAYQTALRLGSTVSPLLTFDLQQDSFYFALDECGYSESGKNWFVASLIAQDIAGKFATGVGIISMAKVSLKLIHLLKQKSKKLFYGLSAAGIAGIIYQTFQQYEKLTNPFESNNQIRDPNARSVTIQQFQEHLQINQITAETDKLEQSVLVHMEKKKRELQKEIQTLTDIHLRNEKNDHNCSSKFIFNQPNCFSRKYSW